MGLITKELLKAFERQGDTSELETTEIRVVCKLFNPYGVGTWWLYEKLDDDIYMAFVELGDPSLAELGTVSISELESLRHAAGFPLIERDIHYTPEVLADVINDVKQRR